MRVNCFLLFTICVLISNSTFAQIIDEFCKGPNNPSPTTTITASSCDLLLNDFVPSTNDRTLFVRVKFWVFVPSTNSTTSIWTNANSPTDSTQAQNLITQANLILANIPMSSHPITGIPYISNSKIQLVYSGFNYLVNDYAYLNTTAFVGTGNYSDPDAINVFLGTETISCASSALQLVSTPTPGICFDDANINAGNQIPALYPHNYIVFHPQFWTSNQWDDLSHPSYPSILCHEVGHVLGLNHTTIGDPTQNIPDDLTIIEPKFGCCNFIRANDFHKDLGTREVCPWVFDNNLNSYGNGSNNLMSQNGACEKLYLSPHQIAVMRYQLTTNQLNLLTAASYTSATEWNTNFDLYLNQNEIWTKDRYLKGNLYIPSGKTLTLKCGLAMTHGSKVIIAKNGQLILDGGHITNISNTTWEGIYVQGDATKNQQIDYSTNPGAGLYQGMLRMKNQAKLSHAEIAVRLYGYSVPGQQTGGIIKAYNSTFLNNRIDVEFKPYSVLFGSASRFDDCDFIVNDFIGFNKSSNQLKSPYSRINIGDIKGVQFYGCNFEYAAGNKYQNPGYGVYAYNSIFNISKSSSRLGKFKNLWKGIMVQNSIPLRTQEISYCEFSDNEVAAYFKNVELLQFNNNVVDLIGSVYTEGVYLNNCKRYKINFNTFSEKQATKGSPGLQIYRSLEGAHEVFGNKFSNLWIGINVMDNNSGLNNYLDGLKMNCNHFKIYKQLNSQYLPLPQLNLYDIALTYGNGQDMPTVMYVQGVSNINANVSNVARNIYGAACGNQNKWYISNVSNKPIIHGCNSNEISLGPVTQPTPQPTCSRSLLTISPLSTPLDYTAHCPSAKASSGGQANSKQEALNNLNNYIASINSNGYDSLSHFELQSSVCSKLNIFSCDSLSGGLDSVVSIIEQNIGHFSDLEAEIIFALINRRKFNEAINKVNLLNSNQAAMATFFTNLITLQSDSLLGLMKLRSEPSLADFFRDIAGTSNSKWKSIAESVLSIACDTLFEEPHNSPDNETNMYRTTFLEQNSTQGNESSIFDNFIYPNPAYQNLIIDFNIDNNESTHLEIHDSFGRKIRSISFKAESSKIIDISQLKSGIYIVTMIRNNQVIKINKLIVLQ